MSASVSATQTKPAAPEASRSGGAKKSEVSQQGSAGVGSREFTAKWGDTVWGHVEKSLKDAGRLEGLSTGEKNARIQRAVNEVKVLDKNGKEIPDKNLIYAGAKYRLVFPGGADQPAKPVAPAPKRAGSDGYRGASGQAAAGAATKTGATTGFGRTDAIASQIALEAINWNYQFELESQGRNFQQAYENAGNFERTKAGVCTDMAFRAARMFEQKGVNARVVGGYISANSPAAFQRSATSAGDGRLQHAWVEYKGDDGQWHRFDPTAAALNKNANEALQAKTSTLYGEAIEYFDIFSATGEAWQPKWAHEVTDR